MNPLMASAASGMRARLESLDTLANNLANAATAGYKTDRESYSTYMAPEALEPALDGDSPTPSALPVVERNWTDFTQGNLTPTGNPLDVALAGKGFFVVNGPSGALYTRNGSFRLSPAGLLTTQDGYAVRGADGKTIRAQGPSPLEISTDGSVQQEGAALGQLAVVTFDQPASVDKAGGNYFRVADSEANPSPAAEVEVHQGKLEASNVTTPETAVRLVNLLRQFEMLQKAAMLGADMDQRAVQDVARVNP
jgi:flagellar basal-body rod protein FlgF